jgi:hypothetical protein
MRVVMVHELCHMQRFFIKKFLRRRRNSRHGIALRNGALALDVGANVGLYSVSLAAFTICVSSPMSRFRAFLACSKNAALETWPFFEWFNFAAVRRRRQKMRRFNDLS